MTESIRALNENDWQAFASIRLEALKNHPGVYASNFAKESAYAEKEWREWLTQNGKCVFGAWDDDKLIGITGIFMHGKDASGHTAVIGASYVRLEARQKGLSNRLYQACIAWALDYPVWRSIVVAHRANNAASNGAIAANGFTLKEVEKDILWPDNTIADQHWHELDLEQLRKQT